MAREINLVPDIKNEMIRTLKMRNLIFFISIVIAIFCVGVVAFFGSIDGGQQLAISNKSNTINKLSEKLGSYGDLDDFLTIRDQLGNVADLTSQHRVLSRTFNILSTLLPTGADTITISELNVNLSADSPTFSFDAQANAGRDPYIDYNVLDSFKKSMQYMKYDYGRYVDKEGTEIPAYCMIETGDDGATLNQDGMLYALWTIEAEGCNPDESEFIATVEQQPTEDEEESAEFEGESVDELDNADDAITEEEAEDEEETSTSSSSTSSRRRVSSDAYETEAYYGMNVVRVWRTPQYNEWYQDGNISLDGQITDIPHFESECITYAGEETDQRNQLKWTEKISDDCNLVPGGESEDGIKISDSSNGRGADDELVLRFSAVITLNPEVYDFNNFHMIAMPPSGRRNVTDSYVQVQAMFGEAARDCDAEDTACTSNIVNLKGGTN